jgi:hydroquinone glucosyltransferase
MGHLILLAELPKRLASRHGTTATLITFASATQRAFLASLPPAIASRALPPVDLSDLPRDAAIETLMSEECVLSLPALTPLGARGEHRPRLPGGVRHQPVRVAAFGAARDAGLRSLCLFMPTNLHALSLVLHLPELAGLSPASSRTSTSWCGCPVACPTRGLTSSRCSRTGQIICRSDTSRVR